VATFFIDTTSGQVATGRQLDEAGLSHPVDGPPPPWFAIKGTSDAITMWYAVMRKQTKGVHIGALCIRHSDHHASLLASGWEEVPVEEIGNGVSPSGTSQAPRSGRRHSM
jgi:hypothetical protein